ncbi:MAG: C-GCAxxG-C-C family protein [Candidatus Latescibacterota bacterium]
MGIGEERVGRRGREIYFDTGFCCSESVLLAVAESKGIESEWFPAIATGFCGGIAHTSGMCGALSGGIMALGLLTGRKKPEDPRDEIFALVQELFQDFQQRFGSTNCTELLRCDLGTPEGMAQVRTGIFRKQCADYVEAAAEIVARLLRDN